MNNEPPPDLSTLENCEAVIQRGRVGQLTTAQALLEISKHKWYREDYQTFERYLKLRWRISRSRGYQLLHLAAVNRMSTMVDTTQPRNERQARVLDGQGKPRRVRPPDFIVRAMDALVRNFQGAPPVERHEFIQLLRGLLGELEQRLNSDGTLK